jgi:hypothetical protein
MNDKEQVINYLRERGLEPTQEDIDFFCGKYGFESGVVWACARIVEMHDNPVIADNVLSEANISHGELKLMPEYDLKFLRPEDPTIPKGVE